MRDFIISIAKKGGMLGGFIDGWLEKVTIGRKT
jgi:hypothetical protein